MLGGYRAQVGMAFEAIADMRLGVFGGLEDCRLGG